MRILQLSDPHLIAADAGLVRGRPALALWTRALDQTVPIEPDCVLVTGDLCQDESWGGYVRLRDTLRQSLCCPVALMPGNHDRPLLLDSVLQRDATTAPAVLLVEGVRLILLNSHWSGHSAGRLGHMQLNWLDQVLSEQAFRSVPTLIALHHPPLAVGHPVLDTMALTDHAPFRRLVVPFKSLKAVVFGHIHQPWQGAWPERPELPLLGCPSTLKGFDHVQPCPLDRAFDPGGRLIEIDDQGALMHQVLRWSDR